MTLERKLSTLFHLSDENWMRHANPISVWTRFSVLPFIMFAFWTRVWIGWWCLIPGGVSIVWMFLNPVIFGKPASTGSWASRAVLGERVFLNRDRIPIPEHHKIPLFPILYGISSAGFLLSIWSVVVYSFPGAFFGILLTILGKCWFLDRMVWLYEDMKGHEEYSFWDY